MKILKEKKNTGLGNRIKKEEKKRKERKSERTDNDVESFFFFFRKEGRTCLARNYYIVISVTIYATLKYFVSTYVFFLPKYNCLGFLACVSVC